MKSKWLLIISFICVLPGCIPAAFVAGATAGGAVIYDNRSMKTIATDNDTTLKAQNRIDTEAMLGNNQTHISVSTFNHIVLLVGQASTSAERDRANELVSGLPNIKRIYNEITIEQPTSMKTRSDDAWITTKVKSRMLAEKGLHSSQIKVITENGTVYLLGLVTRTQGSKAALVASTVTGVQKVVTLFEYQN